MSEQTMKDGIYSMPEDQYRALPFANYSAVKTLCLGGTPAHYLAKQAGDEADTDSKGFGRLVHTAVLKPNDLEAVKCLPDSIKRRAGKEWEQLQAKNPNVTFLPPSEWKPFLADKTVAERIRAEILNHPVAGNFFRDIDTEVALIWTDKTTGVRCKGLIDGLAKDRSFIVDIKTTSRFIPYQIVRSGYFFGYHIQVAMYTDALCTLLDLDMDNPPPFWYVFVESDAPHLILTANAHSAFDERINEGSPLGYLELGREQYISALKTIADCQRSGDWNGHPFDPMEMAIPKSAGWEGVYV